MSESAEKIELSKLPQPESFGIYVGLGLLSAFIAAVAGYFCDYFWAAHSYILAGILAVVLVLPALLSLSVLSMEARADLQRNRQLPARIAKCRSNPLPATDYEKFLAIAKAHPETHGFIAEALDGRDFMTRGEAEALAARINTYLAEAPQRELTALVSKLHSQITDQD